MQLQVVALLIATTVFLTPQLFAEETESSSQGVVKEGTTVTIDYTVKDANGKVLDSGKNKTVHFNRREIIPGLEKRMLGMKEGEEKQIRVPASEAYGEVRKELMLEIPVDKLPPGTKVGDVLRMQTPDGRAYPCRVKEIKDNVAILDLNHPLAGQDLVFDVKVLKVE